MVCLIGHEDCGKELLKYREFSLVLQLDARKEGEERKLRFGRKSERLNGTVKPVNRGQGLIT